MKTAFRHRSGLMILAALAASSSILAQTSPRPALDATDPSSDESITLSPFTVSSEAEGGYLAGKTLAGTRLNTSVKDLGASLSIYTRDLLNDLSVTNVNELLIYATGMEAAGAGGNYSGADLSPQQVTGDSVRTNPQGGTRTRGLASPNYTRNFFGSSVPVDSYNTDAVTVNRGPNAILFGVGSPAGVVDTSLQSANLTRNSTVTEFRYGNNDSLRSTLNLNRVIVPKKLAIRIAALDDQERFNQKPAFEHKERIYGAITLKPFPSTTLRANAESGRTKANRPITVLPLNSINQFWLDAGRPVFDWTLYDDPARNSLAATQNASSFVPLSMRQNQVQDQIVLVYNSTTAQTPSLSYRGTLPSGTGANQVRPTVLHPLVNRDRAADGVIFANTSNVGELPANAFPTGVIPAGQRFQGITDLSYFDFKNRLIDETSRQTENFRTFNVTLEQLFWKNRAGVELAYVEEFFTRRSRNQFFQTGNNNHIRIDTNVTLPDGTPNPNVGRPFAQFGAGNWSDPEVGREAYRGTAFFRHNFAERFPRLGKWLGRHAVTGLFERSAVENLSNNSRLNVNGPAADALNQTVSAFGRRPVVLVYLGDSVLNNAPIRLNPIQIPFIEEGLSATTRYFSAPAGSALQGDFASATTSLSAIAETTSFTREVIQSQAAILQSYWAADHIVTTVGWRRDESHRAQLNVAYDPVTAPTVYYGLDDFNLPGTPPLQAAKEVTSYSVVARWPHRLFRLPAGADFSVFINSSENFTPASGRVNVFDESLGSPVGKTREFGFNLSFFNDRLSIRANHFETGIVGASISGTTGAYSNAYNNGVLGVAGSWAREPNINPSIDRSADIELLFSALPANFRDQVGFRVVRAADGTISTTTPVFPALRADTTDYEARGDELEIGFNPNRQWRFLFNVARQETVQSNIGPNTRDFIERMVPVWQQLSDRPFNNYPVGHVIGTPLPANVTTLGQWLQTQQGPLVPYAALIASEGIASAEQRKWRANLVANYTFANDGRLKGWSLGTGVRWQDKIGIGYPAQRNAAGAVTFDLANPYYAPAETNVDTFVTYRRKFLRNRLDWKVQLNIRNLISSGSDLVSVSAQPDGSPAIVRLAPERRVYLTNTFSF